MDGFQVLERIRANPLCQHVRVVVLTSSEAIHDVRKAYGLGANSFLVKPLEFENIRAFFTTLEAQLWKHDGPTVPVTIPSRTPPPNREIREPKDGDWPLISGW
jgi:DNA-binding response OmpR family regulator